MKRLNWIFIVIAIMGLAASCKKKTDDVVEDVPTPVEPAETQPVEVDESVTPDTTVIEEPVEAPGEMVQRINKALNDVYFDFDKSELRDDAREALQMNARVLSANPEANALIEGHCDERGTEEYNMALGERRAERVRSYLVSLGVDPSRLRTVSYGEMRPKAMGSNEEAWAKNRRAHFLVSLSE